METKIAHMKKFKIKSIKAEKNIYLNENLKLDEKGAEWVYDEVTR